VTGLWIGSSAKHEAYEEIGYTENARFVHGGVAKALPAQNVDASDQDVDVWVSESLKLAETNAYVAPIGDGKGPFTIDQAYCDQMRTVAEQRVVQAGLRLANLLNANLK
jgi:S1/P1 Nuclease